MNEELLLIEEIDEVPTGYKKGSLIDQLVLFGQELQKSKSDVNRLKVIEALETLDVTPAAIGSILICFFYNLTVSIFFL